MNRRATSQTRLVASALAFDRVLLDIDEASGPKEITVEEFLQIPLDERIRLNLARKLRFTRNGAVVDPSEALRSLMAAARDLRSQVS